MFCDDCAVEPATIDHLDLTGPEAHLRRLCPACAERERLRWQAERLLQPQGLVAAAQPDRRAA